MCVYRMTTAVLSFQTHSEEKNMGPGTFQLFPNILFLFVGIDVYFEVLLMLRTHAHVICI